MLSVIKKYKIQKIKINLFFIYTSVILLFIAFNVQSSEKLKDVAFGDENSNVIIKVFSSLTCPHCANFHIKVFNKLKKDFIGENTVRLEHHGFPLDLAALNAEKILRCINDSQKRLSFLDEIYEKQDVWAVGNDINSINLKLKKIAKKYDLNDDMIKTCLENENLEDQILESRINGSKKYSIQSTPTILINDKIYDGKHNYEDLKKEIKKNL